MLLLFFIFSFFSVDDVCLAWESNPQQFPIDGWLSNEPYRQLSPYFDCNFYAGYKFISKYLDC